MTIRGHVRNGVVVPDDPTALPEGAKAQIEILPADAVPITKRQGGQYAGKIQMADDFDEWPVVRVP